MHWWATINGAQATIVSSLITCLAAIVGVMLGWWLFRGKVRDLSSALSESERHLSQHREFVSRELKAIADSLVALSDQAASTIEGLGQVRGEVSDLNRVEPEPAADAQQQQADDGPDQKQDEDVASFQENWSKIRDSLESKAADTQIDGRTRARYGRIDRRNYYELIKALEQDGRLPDAAAYRDAVDIWYAHRTRRAPVTAEHARQINDIRRQLVGD